MLSAAFADAFVSTPAATQKPGAAVSSAVVQPIAIESSTQGNVSTMSLGAFGVFAAGASILRSKKSKATAKPAPVQLYAFESELGVQAPVGFWDPVGFTADGDEAAFKRRRSVEIKHGRICMMATMGYITPEVVGKLPGFLSPSAGLKFADVPNGLAAISKVPTAGWAQIAAYFGFVEFSGGFDDYKGGTPGDYGFKVLTSDDPEEKSKKLSAEIANGRLAMMAIIGMFFQDGLTGSAWGSWASYTDSPLRFGGSDVSAPAKPKFDPETELGVQDPIGFWDPLDFCAEKDEADFKRRRTVEIKHGRISMYATIGYIVPEYFRFPGDLSPSAGLKFADMPNGLAALSKLPALGGAQMVAFAGIIETTGFFSGSSTSGRGPRALGQMKDSTEEAEPGNYGIGFPNFIGTVSDPEERKTKLAAELANGRLAMMAIIGMFFQDGLTGSAWGDWATYTGSPLRAFETELGVQAPVGFWDPAGLSKDGDMAAFKRRRVTEVKHGRLSMIACIGYIVPEYVKFPGYLAPKSDIAFSDIPNGLGAFDKVPGAGWMQMFAFAAAVDTAIYPYSADRDAGDLKGAGAFGIPGGGSIEDPERRKRSLNAEIANGRLAMMAIIGMMYQDGFTGSAWGDWANYTDSPLRAYENELGVQAPVGFWDPVGYSKDGSEEDFRRRRCSELKHGRISMIAAMGYITPEFTKFPGYLAPHLGLKFSDVPNGLAALSKVPNAGWGQMVFFAGLLETGFFVQEDGRDPGDFANAGTLGVPNGGAPMEDADNRKRKLNSELANGRLAMMAIIGMFFQDGLSGSAWGDWALFTASPLRAFETELGVQAPVGFFDPLGLAKDGDMAAFKRRRVTEIKHGRISMLACMGYIVPEYVKFPGDLAPKAGIAFADVPNGLNAFDKVPAAGWMQLFAFGAAVDTAIFPYSADRDAGDLKGAGAFGFPGAGSIEDPEKRKRSLNAELANGRLAMMAIIGMMYQDGFTGSAWGDWANYTDSPLRAYENELGVQAPVGFWDPVGYSKDGSEADFRRRRCSEVKHGRISMIAAMGYITPEFTKFPGYLAPHLGLKFSDVPNGLAALGKVPQAGWGQMVFFAGLLETGFFVQEDGRDPGDFANAGTLGVPNGGAPMEDADNRKRKLNSELANGRLAMMAIIGMFFQDGLSGSAWGDWALYTGSPLR